MDKKYEKCNLPTPLHGLINMNRIKSYTPLEDNMRSTKQKSNLSDYTNMLPRLQKNLQMPFLTIAKN